MPLGKIKTPILKAKKILIAPLLPVKNSYIVSTISAKRNQISYSNGQKPHQVLLAGKPSASWKKRKFPFFQGLDAYAQGWVAPFSLGGRTCCEEGYTIVARWTIKGIPCRQVSRRQAVNLLDLFLSLAEQGFYLFQGKWEEILASSSAWPHTEARTSPILPLKYQIETVGSCRVSDLSLKNRSCQQLSYTEVNTSQKPMPEGAGEEKQSQGKDLFLQCLGYWFGVRNSELRIFLLNFSFFFFF